MAKSPVHTTGPRQIFLDTLTATPGCFAQEHSRCWTNGGHDPTDISAYLEPIQPSGYETNATCIRLCPIVSFGSRQLGSLRATMSLRIPGDPHVVVGALADSLRADAHEGRPPTRLGNRGRGLPLLLHLLPPLLRFSEGYPGLGPAPPETSPRPARSTALVSDGSQDLAAPDCHGQGVTEETRSSCREPTPRLRLAPP